MHAKQASFKIRCGWPARMKGWVEVEGRRNEETIAQRDWGVDGRMNTCMREGWDRSLAQLPWDLWKWTKELTDIWEYPLFFPEKRKNVWISKKRYSLFYHVPWSSPWKRADFKGHPLPSTHITETEMKAKNSLSRTKDADENNPWAANNLKRILGHRTFLVHTKQKFSHKKFRLNTYTPNHS